MAILNGNPAIADCAKSAGAEVVYYSTECFV